MAQMQIQGRVLLGALASGVLATVMMGGAPTANATCASIFGIGNTADCTSNLTSIAIAIGPGAVAHADGLFGSAMAIGMTNGVNEFTIAQTTTGLFSFAYAGGVDTIAGTQGNFGLAVVQGKYATALAGQSTGDNFNTAINLGGTGVDMGFPYLFNPFTNPVLAAGQGNLAVNIGGTTIDPSKTKANGVQAVGVGNSALNIGGVGNQVFAGNNVGPIPSTLSTAFNILGDGNKVTAQPGPLAVAGSIFRSGAIVTKVGPGFNINGFSVGAAPVDRSAKTATPTRAVTATDKTRDSAAASGLHHTKSSARASTHTR